MYGLLHALGLASPISSHGSYSAETNVDLQVSWSTHPVAVPAPMPPKEFLAR